MSAVITSAATMSPLAKFAPHVLDTILTHLAALFVTASDATAARYAATQTLAAYDVETEEELGLAADIISFGLHALQALSQAAAPDLSLTKILRLRGGAVSLSREGHKSRRKLDQLQRTRRTAATQPTAHARSQTLAPQPATPVQQPEAPAPALDAPTPRPEALAAQPKAGPAQLPADQAAGPIASLSTQSAGKYDSMTWTQAYRQRQTTKRLAKKALKAQARLAAQPAANPAAT